MKTTKKHFKIFKKEVKKWINYFGLWDWQIHFAHYAENMTNTRAKVIYNSTGCLATFILNTKWHEHTEDVLNKNNIRKAAFHEVCELLLGRLTHIADDRWGWCEADLTIETHRIIRTLENVLWK